MLAQDSVLLVGSTDKSRALLTALVPNGSCAAVKVCQSGGEARRQTAMTAYDIILVNTPLSDESGLDLAMELTRQTLSGVMLLVKAELAETVASRVEEYGVIVVPKPVSKPLFDQAMHFMDAARARMQSLQAENDRLQKKLAELRLIDRAKCILIQYLGMTEEQAHRQIEKQAMDTRQTKAYVAQSILDQYAL